MVQIKCPMWVGGYNINKLPGNSKYKSAFLASMIVIGVVCVPKFIMESNKKQGHGYFDNEMPEDVRKSREYIYNILNYSVYINIHDNIMCKISLKSI